MNGPENERIGPVEARWQGGQKGDKGDKGERGPGLSQAVRRGIVGLFILGAAFGLLGIYGQVRADLRIDRQQATINAQQHMIARQQRELAAQDAASARVRCESIAQIVSIPVPVPVRDNPSREWVYRYVRIQRQRGRHLGCKLPPPKYVTVTKGN